MVNAGLTNERGTVPWQDPARDRAGRGDEAARGPGGVGPGPPGFGNRRLVLDGATGPTPRRSSRRPGRRRRGWEHGSDRALGSADRPLPVDRRFRRLEPLARPPTALHLRFHRSGYAVADQPFQREAAMTDW